MLALGLFLLGLAVLIVGSELLVRGGSRIAAMLGISPIVVGLTVVSIGTSFPELAVGIEAAIQGNGAIAVGNIAGTNIVNLLLILGLAAVLRPLKFELTTLRLDLPSMVIAALTLLFMGFDLQLSRAEGIIMVLLAIGYTALVVKSARVQSVAVRREFSQEFAVPPRPRAGRTEFWTNLTALLGGIIIIVVGADWLVDGAVELARLIGASDAFIGLTVVAIGTSAPELVTAIVATVRGERNIAIGNLIGSSTYNILLILGITALVPSGGIPVSPSLAYIDIPVMVAVVVACVPLFLTRRGINRIEGSVMIAAYFVYLAYLLVTRI
ncbi:calcium/sodium antiporter [Cryobacterium sp. BB307]|uniref:calcium/sodium antiporter n=1 Tax=Cryobacterium sp. BB307 TaxID=2716317 RepID=UPI001447BFAA|nr:calcium/sodium antiporter [Cryobacterium sp. BB307]